MSVVGHTQFSYLGAELKQAKITIFPHGDQLKFGTRHLQNVTETKSINGLKKMIKQVLRDQVWGNEVQKHLLGRNSLNC